MRATVASTALHYALAVLGDAAAAAITELAVSASSCAEATITGSGLRTTL
jgi:hypothetical protein